MRRFLCILLILLLPYAALGEGISLSFTAEGSNLWPDGTADALRTLLCGMTLTVSDTGEDTVCLLARDGQTWLSLASGTPRVTLERMLTLSADLGTLLSDYEREEHRSIEMGEVMTSTQQLTYALTREEWQEKQPEAIALIAAVFPEFDLSDFEITGEKATFKRYFARDGQEIGAYFYAAQAQVAPDDIREIRLEWGCRAEKGLYLAFRCPGQGKGEERNLKISFSARISKQTSWSCEIRRVSGDAQHIFSAEGRYTDDFTDGKSSASYQRKNGKQSVKYTLDLKPDGSQTSAYTVKRSGKLLLSGTFSWAEASLPDVFEAQSDPSVLAHLLVQTLVNEDPENAQALLQALCASEYLSGDTTQLRVTEQPAEAADKEESGQ